MENERLIRVYLAMKLSLSNFWEPNSNVACQTSSSTTGASTNSRVSQGPGNCSPLGANPHRQRAQQIPNGQPAPVRRFGGTGT
jgi:hypothetical protein